MFREYYYLVIEGIWWLDPVHLSSLSSWCFCQVYVSGRYLFGKNPPGIFFLGSYLFTRYMSWWMNFNGKYYYKNSVFLSRELFRILFIYLVILFYIVFISEICLGIFLWEVAISLPSGSFTFWKRYMSGRKYLMKYL